MSETNKNAGEVASDVDKPGDNTPADNTAAAPGDKKPETEDAPRLDD